MGTRLEKTASVYLSFSSVKKRWFWNLYTVYTSCTGKTLKFINCNIPQSTESSSDLSWHSGWVLHKKCGLVQFPSLHWNWPTGQYRCGQVGGSSEPSRQSLCPSHFHQIGIHLQRENSVFFLEDMSLQIYNHPFTAQKTVLSQSYFLQFPRHLAFHVFCFMSNANKICQNTVTRNSLYWWASRRKLTAN